MTAEEELALAKTALGEGPAPDALGKDGPAAARNIFTKATGSLVRDEATAQDQAKRLEVTCTARGCSWEQPYPDVASLGAVDAAVFGDQHFRDSAWSGEIYRSGLIRKNGILTATWILFDSHAGGAR